MIEPCSSGALDVLPAHLGCRLIPRAQLFALEARRVAVAAAFRTSEPARTIVTPQGGQIGGRSQHLLESGSPVALFSDRSFRIVCADGD